MGEVTRVPLALLIAVVATFAEMRCAKAKPYRDGAAVAAFVFQKVCAMLRTDLSGIPVYEKTLSKHEQLANGDLERNIQCAPSRTTGAD
eukprot:COSAG05_NODE_6413_length_963_cov_0.718750_1_plen_89_part_00